jgi:3-hydroxy-9,10-secoandrosta-1,3,5(10)-triene-9,17-dione monooxygenase
MIPALAERAARGEQNRRLAEETMAEMQNAGLFRVIQPKRWGGYELRWTALCDIQLALAEGDLSTAWIYGNLAGLSGHLALFDDRAARDVWGGHEKALVCCSMMRTGRAVPVEGGFRLSGQWKYLSGCHYCDWAILGGNVVMDGADRAEARVFLVPREHIELRDTWYVAGLKATGSLDASIEDAFVPDYRSHKLADYLRCSGPGQTSNTAALYRLPLGQLFARGPSIGSIGALQGMLDAFLQYGRARTTVTGSKTAEDPAAQLVCAETSSAIDEMITVLHRNFQNLQAYAERDEEPPLLERMRYKFQSAEAAERCSLLAARLFKAAGAGGLSEAHPFGRFLADINAARQHIANQFEMHGRNWGASLLGLKSPVDFFL